MADVEEIADEVTYALSQSQVLLEVRVPAGATVKAAILRSGILDRFDIDLAVNKVGVFGKLCPLERVLQDGDRVEIYRPLVADPKDVRRRLAAEGRSMGRKGRGPASG
jgi:putative ubiquitin-RnfH superfamily antitoxin RatB of RatAB toxin-antitoxin module